jgi:DNA polymerase I-like protein with 3'-5' exonuclease and polymerase domains
VNSDARTKLLTKSKNKEHTLILTHLGQFKKYAKLGSTYTNMEVDPDGRVRTSYSFISTWRLSSSESHFGGGGNLQNIPRVGEEAKAIRSLFIPDDGYEMGAMDYSAAETWIYAFESEDPVLMHNLTHGVDVHWELVREELDFTQDAYDKENPEHQVWRQMAKRIRHAGTYGMGPYLLQALFRQDGMFYEFAYCKNLLTTHNNASPFILNWQREIRETIKATRTLISAGGRKREFMGRLNDTLFRVAYAFSPQNTVGEMMEAAIQKIHEELDHVTPLLNVHDEVIYQNAPEDRLRAAKDCKQIAEVELEINRRIIKIPVNFKAGPNWGELKSFNV